MLNLGADLVRELYTADGEDTEHMLYSGPWLAKAISPARTQTQLIDILVFA